MFAPIASITLIQKLLQNRVLSCKSKIRQAVDNKETIIRSWKMETHGKTFGKV